MKSSSFATRRRIPAIQLQKRSTSTLIAVLGRLPFDISLSAIIPKMMGSIIQHPTTIPMIIITCIAVLMLSFLQKKSYISPCDNATRYELMKPSRSPSITAPMFPDSKPVRWSLARVYGINTYERICAPHAISF